MKTQFLAFITLSITALLFTGCSTKEDLQKGRIKINLTDAPFPTDLVEKATVTINKIDIKKVGDGESDGKAFITLLEGDITLNLLELTNGVTTNLADLEIPVGDYDQIRLYVSTASVELKTGTTYNLTVPSGAQTGIKVNVSPSIPVVGGLTSDLLLDFDVSRSFVPQGNINGPRPIQGFIFKPVIKATNMSEVGRLTGFVSDSTDVRLVGAEVAVWAADTLNTTTFTDSNGNYTVLGLTPGIYALQVSFEELPAVTIENISIVAGNAVTQNVKIDE